jgi:hypothetical protein
VNCGNGGEGDKEERTEEVLVLDGILCEQSDGRVHWSSGMLAGVC